MPTPEDITAYRTWRGLFLSTLWDLEAEGANTYGLGVSVEKVVRRAGLQELSEAQVARLVNDAIGDDMIEGEALTMASTYPQEVGLTSTGRLEVERWIEGGAPTEHLQIPPSQVFTTIIQGSVTGSAVVVGSTGTNVAVNNASGEQLSTLLVKARELLDSWRGDDEDREEVQADLATIDDEVNGPSSNRGRVRVALRRIGKWATVAAAAGVSAELSEQVSQLAQDALRQI